MKLELLKLRQMLVITSRYKFSILLIGYLILFLQASAQVQNREFDIRTLVQRGVGFYPLSYDEWETNTKLYFGYSLILRFQGNQVTEAIFSQETPSIVLRRNESLIAHPSAFFADEDLGEVRDGLHVFPIICEMITIPKKELQDNLSMELEKIVPALDRDSGEMVMVHKPMLIKIYPPKR